MKTKFDPRVPYNLKVLQEWFGKIIEQKLTPEQTLPPFSPKGNTIIEEAKIHIQSSLTLQPHERMEIYGRQYWWRLLTTLTEQFPALTCLFGINGFKEMLGIPFFLHEPPQEWNINLIGQTLPDWIEEHYHARDKKLVMPVSEIDWGFCECFFKPFFKPFTLENTSLIDQAHVPLYLQPHVQLFELDYDLLTFRAELLKEEPDYWVENPFPKIDKAGPFYYTLWRTRHNQIVWAKGDLGEYTLLKEFINGISIQELLERNVENLDKWIAQWIQRGLLTYEYKYKSRITYFE